MTMVFQDPMTSLSPVKRGEQITETLRYRLGDDKAAKKKAIDLLEQVNPRAVLAVDQYPHELSGGLRQRVVIAMALAASRRC